MNRHSLFSLAVLLLAPLTLLQAAEPAKTWPPWQKNRVALDRHVVVEEFTLHYAITGKDGHPAADQADLDQDKVPDKIQNIARQLVAARRCFVEGLGLRHPLESPRYRGRVKAIDVNLWDLGKKNGSAGDAIVNYHRPTDPPEGVEVLTIDLSAKLPPYNLSPAHELFHLFQNGYSLFKNAWYYEGTARWSEDLLRAGLSPADPLPESRAEVDALFARSYDASRTWAALARVTDPVGRLALPSALRESTYLDSAIPIIRDDVFYGGPFLKTFLEELDRADDVMSQAEGLDPLNWPEVRQRAPENNSVIWAALVKVSRDLAPGTPLFEFSAAK